MVEALAKLEGSIAAVQSNGQWTESSGNVYRTSDNVGIGTTTPNNILTLSRSQSSGTQIDITNSSTDTNAFAGITVNNSSKYGSINIASTGGTDRFMVETDSKGLDLFSGAATGDIRAFTGGFANANERLRITSSGNVGIGTTNPTDSLHVKTANTTAATFETPEDDDSTYQPLRIYRSRSSATAPAAGFGVGLNFSLESFTNNSNIQAGRINTQWETAQTDDTNARDSRMTFSLMKDGATNEYMRIDSNGNVGLGTSIPTTRLHVAGSIILGNGGEDCTGGNFAGAVRYNAGAVQFCNGTSWQSFSAGGGSVDPTNLSSAVPVNKGGTGLTASGAGNTILGVNAAGSGLEYKSIAGAGSVTVAHAAGGVTITGSDTPGGTASGDLSGTYPSPTVDGLQGRAVSSAAPGTNDVLSFNGTSWIPSDISSIMGTISIANGGTGAGSAQFTAGGAIVYYNSATTRFEQLTCASDEALKYNIVTGWNCVTADNLFKSWSLKTANYSAAAGDRIFVDTSSSQVTVTLPATPAMGHRIEIVHVGGDLATNKMVIARNGEPIMALAEDMDVTSNNISLEMIYVDATRGWRIK